MTIVDSSQALDGKKKEACGNGPQASSFIFQRGVMYLS